MTGPKAPATRSPQLRPAAPLPCTGRPDLYYADVPEHVQEAMRLCGPCPVRDRCLDGAVARGERWGVWGGHPFRDGKPLKAPPAPGRPRKDGGDPPRAPLARASRRA